MKLVWIRQSCTQVGFRFEVPGFCTISVYFGAQYAAR
jgi:hypothetical protein